jgi:hypothetical protein
MHKARGLSLSPGTLAGLFFIHKYRFLTIAQFARLRISQRITRENVLRGLERRGMN